MSAVQQYRKKPVVIEAAQFTDNGSALDILKWSGTPPITAEIDAATGAATALLVDTLEGRMRASVGDYVIRGVSGEFYPCKPDIFAATYDAVTSGPVPQPSSAAMSEPSDLPTSASMLAKFYKELTEEGVPPDVAHHVLIEYVRNQPSGALRVKSDDQVTV